MKYMLALFLFLFSCSSFANYAVVDFSKPSTEKRFFIYSNGHKLLFSTYVAHGSGSGTGIWANSFSNVFGSKASSLGTYKVAQIHFGKYGKVYRMAGLDRTNSNAFERYIEIHPAPYIGNGRTGTSWGCFAVPDQDFYNVMYLLKVGDILIAEK